MDRRIQADFVITYFPGQRFTGGIRPLLCMGPAFSAGPMYEWRVIQPEGQALFIQPPSVARKGQGTTLDSA